MKPVTPLSLTLTGIALALLGPGAIALGSNLFIDDTTPFVVRALFILLFWGLTAAVAIIAIVGEGLTGEQVGFCRISWTTVWRALALAAFFILVFGPLAGFILTKLGFPSFDAGQAKLAGLPLWYLVLATVSVAAAEEWLYRGYAIERLQTLVDNPWVAGGISLLFFTLAHLPLWGFGVSLTTLISGAILTALYIRYRDVLFLILAHVLTDLYGMVIARLTAP